VAVKLRYRARPVAASLVQEGGSWRVLFDHPQGGVAPGQAAVVYRGDEVLGGGIIESAIKGDRVRA
jgi:tRNA-specific 2-thiouridylase